MTEQQIPKFVALLVEHQRKFVALTNEEAQWVIQNVATVIAIVVDAIKAAYTKAHPLLKFVGEVIIPAGEAGKKFVARERFVVCISTDAQVVFDKIWGNFGELFLAGDGKIEEPLPERALRYCDLVRDSLDHPIIAELGGEEKVESALAGVHALMAMQPRGEAGVLLTNGYSNIFYVRDQGGVLRRVQVYWLGSGWSIMLVFVESSRVGCRVFSSNNS